MKYTKFSDLTVAQYQELYNINRSDTDDIDKAIRSVSVLTGLASWQVEDLSLDEFSKISREIATIFSEQVITARLKKFLTISGKRYRIIYNPRKLSAGQYIDFQHFLSGNTIENLHKLVACIIVPYKSYWRLGKYDSENHEKISEGVQDLNFMEVNAVCVFFSKLWSDSITALEPYLIQELKAAGMERIQPTDLQKIMAGFTTPAG